MKAEAGGAILTGGAGRTIASDRARAAENHLASNRKTKYSEEWRPTSARNSLSYGVLRLVPPGPVVLFFPVPVQASAQGRKSAMKDTFPDGRPAAQGVLHF